MHTPWGQSQTIEKVGTEGILWVSTASHGGFYVPDRLLSKIPAEHQEYAEKWSGSKNWYEEDCAWACVAVAFPQLCNKPGEQDAARDTIKHWIEKAEARS